MKSKSDVVEYTKNFGNFKYFFYSFEADSFLISSLRIKIVFLVWFIIDTYHHIRVHFYIITKKSRIFSLEYIRRLNRVFTEPEYISILARKLAKMKNKSQIPEKSASRFQGKNVQYRKKYSLYLGWTIPYFIYLYYV